MKNLIFLIVPFIFNCQLKQDFHLQEGDILFQDSDCGDFCEAIEAVTYGVDNYEFSHVGLVMKDANGDLKVMEAVYAGVVLTPIDSFMNRSFDAKNHPKVVVGRLKKKYQKLVPGAINFIQSKLNAPYDFVFDIDNDSYYCSELIHLAFKKANNNYPIFETAPMTFIAPNTNQTFPIWQSYFEDLKVPIPEGKLGLNPGGMSRSTYIGIVHKYGNPGIGNNGSR